MEVKIKQRMFVEDGDFLVNEQGKKYTRLGFDDVKLLGENLVYYRLGKFCNVVTKQFVQTHKHKLDYITPAKYTNFNNFQTFCVLSSNADGGNIKIVNNNGEEKLFFNAKYLFNEKEKYISFEADGKVYFVSNSTIKSVNLQSENCQPLCNFTGNLNKQVENISSIEDINNLTDILTQLLNEDIENYKNPTLKYVLVEYFDGKTTPVWDNKLNKALSSYSISLLNRQYDSKQQAEQNAKNVLNFYKTKLQAELTKTSTANI